MVKKDILIIGSGIAGLSFALHIAKTRPDLSICILTKSREDESNTRYAQGGIAVVLDKITDSFQQHIDDTLKSGGGICNKEIVEMVVKKAPKRLWELIDWGVEFDKSASGEFSVGLEGGHSQPRILHHKDSTGLEIEQKLLHHISQFKNVSILSHHFALDLIIEKSKNICIGAYVLNQNNHSVEVYSSKITMLATGGSGQVYKTTTNPKISTGDGVAMASRAGATIKNMQFVQFHPTAFYHKDSNPAFLISEAVRGFGAYLLNHEGRRFLFDSDIRGELATRDIVSNAISCELKKSKEDYVFLDCRHLEEKDFKKHFPTITNHCKMYGINVAKDLIPVAPAAHYQCGGIEVNNKSQTSCKQLYACGECASTGLHGSNRLASNSLLEAVVFSYEAAADVLAKIDELLYHQPIESRIFNDAIDDSERIVKLRDELTTSMVKNAGIVKQKSDLINELSILKHLELMIANHFKNNTPHTDLWELKNLVEVSKLITEQTLEFLTKNLTKKINTII